MKSAVLSLRVSVCLCLAVVCMHVGGTKIAKAACSGTKTSTEKVGCDTQVIAQGEQCEDYYTEVTTGMHAQCGTFGGNCVTVGPECEAAAAPSCASTSLLNAASGVACVQNIADAAWGGGSKDCRPMIDSQDSWGGATARHIYDSNGWAELDFKKKKVVTKVGMSQWSGGVCWYWKWEYLDSQGAWQTIKAHTAAIPQTDTYELETPVATTKVRVKRTHNSKNYVWRIRRSLCMPAMHNAATAKGSEHLEPGNHSQMVH